MKKIIVSILVLSALSFSSFSHADWGYSYNSFMKKWIVSDGKSSIQLKTEKAAKKTAKKLNKNDKKVAKSEDSFYNDGSDRCNNPLNEC